MPLALRERLQGTSTRVREKFRTEPLSAYRLLFWSFVWILAVTQITIGTRLFRRSLPFVFNDSSPIHFNQGGLEDSRRQAIPILVTADLCLTVLMPFFIGLPLVGIFTRLESYAIEASWSLLVTFLLLGGSAALSPLPSSPALPKVLMSDLSALLGLSFTLLMMLVAYNFLLFARITYLSGKGTVNIFQASVLTILHPEIERPDKNQSIGEKITPFAIDLEPGHPKRAAIQSIRPDSPISPLTAKVVLAPHSPLRRGTDGSVGVPASASIKTLSSGWDDDEEDQGPKEKKRKPKNKN